MNCEMYDREALERGAFVLAKLCGPAEDPELINLQEQFQCKLFALGGGPVATVTCAPEVCVRQELVSALLDGLSADKRAWLDQGIAESKYVDYGLPLWPRRRCCDE